MAMDAEAEKTVIEAHAKHEGDTGSPEVQVALLTALLRGLPGTSKNTKRTSIPVRACSSWWATVATF